MPGLLSSAMLTELESVTPRVFPLCGINMPDSSTFTIAGNQVEVDGIGSYKPKVTRWAPIVRRLSDRDSGLQLSTAGVTFRDDDKVFSNYVGTYGLEAIRGRAFAIALGSIGVAVANWFSAFVGTVATARMVSPFVWEVTAESNQHALRVGKFPKVPILQADWPNVFDKGLYGTWPPLIYGIHDSRGSGDNGLVPCPYVDTLGFRYLVSHGWTTVDRVYVDGVLQGSGYTEEHETINGRLFTLIDFTSDQGDDAVVTADVTGYEDQGDGGGSTLTGADALAHLLTNFIYGDYQGGTWASTTGNINATHFATVQGLLEDIAAEKVSVRYGGDEQTLGMDAINEWCKTLGVDTFWTGLGKLAICYNNPLDTTLWHDTPQHVIASKDELSPFMLEWDRTRLCSRLALSFLYGSAAGQYMQQTEVTDEAATEDVLASLDLPWSHASLL